MAVRIVGLRVLSDLADDAEHQPRAADAEACDPHTLARSATIARLNQADDGEDQAQRPRAGNDGKDQACDRQARRALLWRRPVARLPIGLLPVRLLLRIPARLLLRIPARLLLVSALRLLWVAALLLPVTRWR